MSALVDITEKRVYVFASGMERRGQAEEVYGSFYGVVQFIQGTVRVPDLVFRKNVADELAEYVSAKGVLILHIEGDTPVEIAGRKQLKGKIDKRGNAQQQQIFDFLFHSERCFPVVEQSAYLFVQVGCNGEIAVPRVFEIVA